MIGSRGCNREKIKIADLEATIRQDVKIWTIIWKTTETVIDSNYLEFHCQRKFIFFLHVSKMRWNRKISWSIITYLTCNFLALSKSINTCACVSTGVSVQTCFYRAVYEKTDRNAKKILIENRGPRYRTPARTSHCCSCDMPGYVTSSIAWLRTDIRKSIWSMQTNAMRWLQLTVVTFAFDLCIFENNSHVDLTDSPANESALVSDF